MRNPPFSAIGRRDGGFRDSIVAIRFDRRLLNPPYLLHLKTHECSVEESVQALLDLLESEGLLEP